MGMGLHDIQDLVAAAAHKRVAVLGPEGWTMERPQPRAAANSCGQVDRIPAIAIHGQ